MKYLFFITTWLVTDCRLMAFRTCWQVTVNKFPINLLTVMLYSSLIQNCCPLSETCLQFSLSDIKTIIICSNRFHFSPFSLEKSLERPFNKLNHFSKNLPINLNPNHKAMDWSHLQSILKNSIKIHLPVSKRNSHHLITIPKNISKPNFKKSKNYQKI